jgi:hypothetical protein
VSGSGLISGGICSQSGPKSQLVVFVRPRIRQSANPKLPFGSALDITGTGATASEESQGSTEPLCYLSMLQPSSPSTTRQALCSPTAPGHDIATILGKENIFSVLRF